MKTNYRRIYEDINWRLPENFSIIICKQKNPCSSLPLMVKKKNLMDLNCDRWECGMKIELLELERIYVIKPKRIIDETGSSLIGSWWYFVQIGQNARKLVRQSASKETPFFLWIKLYFNQKHEFIYTNHHLDLPHHHLN